MLRVVIAVAVLVTFVYGLVDVIRTDGRLAKGISKPAWIVVMVVLPVVGAALWFIIGRPKKSDRIPQPYAHHPLAPDDDPDFLRNLELRRRQQAEAARLKKLRDEMDAKERGTQDGSRADDDPGEAGRAGDPGADGSDEVK
jgi:hypothetical protein